jgi:hypothetical protein
VRNAARATLLFQQQSGDLLIQQRGKSGAGLHLVLPSQRVVPACQLAFKYISRS